MFEHPNTQTLTLMEEKQSQISTYIGLGLIFLLLFLWMQYSAPPKKTPEQLQAEQAAQQVQQTPQPAEAAAAPAPVSPAPAAPGADSMQQMLTMAKFGPFAAAAAGQ